ncbi:hypothetical protein BaRGS_00008576, partial [Batillaria attramentaria]
VRQRHVAPTAPVKAPNARPVTCPCPTRRLPPLTTYRLHVQHAKKEQHVAGCRGIGFHHKAPAVASAVTLTSMDGYTGFGAKDIIILVWKGGR